ncbi:MAG: dipeptidase [Deltaproteobacteria bacterium]|nr:dipeptidase [Deltaproteobacteria bacterium]
MRIRGHVTAVAVALLLLAALLPTALAAGKKKPNPAPITRVFDLHCDTVYQGVTKGWDLKKNKGAVDLGKLRKGAYLAQTFALWTPPMGGWTYLKKLNHKFETWMTQYDGKIGLATTGQEILDREAEGRIAAVLSIEGLRPLDGEPEKIRALYEWGVRILGLTWWKSNEFAGSSTDPDEEKRAGLTEKGREAVRLANELGMVIDVSHASDEVVRQVAELSEDPFFATHSCARALKDHNRNLSDEMLKLIASRGGVVGVNTYVGFLSDDPAGTVKRSTYVDHVMHMVGVMGVDHVALGSDFDGAKPPMGLKHAGQMQLLAHDLLDEGLSQKDVDKIMYLNALRVFSQVTAKPGPAETLAGLAWPQPW